MDLFDYINKLFSTDEQWDKVNSYDKKKNHFMLQRFMAIKYPMQSNLMNILKINPVGVSSAWRLIGKKFNRVPGFIYTKVNRKKKEKKNNWTPDEAAVDYFMKINEIGRREFDLALKFKFEETKKAINNISKGLKDDVN